MVHNKKIMFVNVIILILINQAHREIINNWKAIYELVITNITA